MEDLEWGRSVFKDATNLTEKWKHLNGASRRGHVHSDCTLGSARYRSVRRDRFDLSFACPPKVELYRRQACPQSFSIGGSLQLYVIGYVFCL